MSTAAPTVSVSTGSSSPVIRTLSAGRDIVGDVLMGFMRGAQGATSRVGSALKTGGDSSAFFEGAPYPQPESVRGVVYLSPAPPVRASFFDSWYNAHYRIPGHGYQVASDTKVLATAGGFI
jgi:hypothetical protein